MRKFARVVPSNPEIYFRNTCKGLITWQQFWVRRIFEEIGDMMSGFEGPGFSKYRASDRKQGMLSEVGILDFLVLL